MVSRTGYIENTSLINRDGTDDAATDSVKEVYESDEELEEIESTENNTDSTNPIDKDEASEIIKNSTAKEDSENEEVAETEASEDNAYGATDSSEKYVESEKIEIRRDSTNEGDKDEEVGVKETTEDSVGGEDEKMECSTDSGKDKEEVDEDRSTNAVANEDCSVFPPSPVHVSSSTIADSISNTSSGIGNTNSIAKANAMEDPKKDQCNLKDDDAKCQGDNVSTELCNDSIFRESANNDGGEKMSYVEQIVLERAATYAPQVPAEAEACITTNTGNSDIGSSVAVAPVSEVISDSDIEIATVSEVSSGSDIETGDQSWPDLQRSITESTANSPGAYAVGNSQSQPNGPEHRPVLRGILSRNVAEAETESSNSDAEAPGESEERVVTVVVEATIVDDVVVEARVVGKDDSARGWSKRCMLAASLTVLTVIALICGIVVSSLDNGSELPPDIAAILALGEGEACVNTNPTKCACYDGDGYLGTINTTVNGLSCQRWDSQTPHSHTTEKSEQYPNLDENYCRQTDSYASPWCYTTDPDTRWEYCTVPQCPSYTVPIALSEVESFPPIDPFCSQDSRQPEETTSGLYLDGISNHVVITNSSLTPLNLAGGPFTIETWVKPSEKSDFSTILSNKEAGAGKSGFIFSINTWEQSNARLYFEGTYSRMASTVSLQWDTWQHVAVTYDGESSLIFYLDGDQIPHYPADGYYAPLSIKRSYLDTKIGEVGLYYQGAITTEHNSHFKGVIDELRVWDHVRSPQDIRLSMDCEGFASEPGLLAYYQFNEESADYPVVHDSSPNGNNGVIIDDTGQIQENGDDFGEISQGSRYTQGITLCTECSSI